jgi:signal transduction histidine kinase
MNKKLTLKQVLILFIIVMGVLITMATMAYNRLVSLVESTEAINRSNVFAMKLEEVISCLKDAESGSRGFLLTRNSEFLLDQKSAGTIVHRNLLDIRQEAKKSVEQIPYIDSIRRLAIAKIDNVWSVVHTIKTREVKTLDENQLHLIQEGKVLMDSLQGAIKNLKELQRKELKINIGKQQDFAESTPRFLLINIIGATIIIVTTMWVIYRQLLFVEKAKRRLEEKINELDKANRELDQYAFTLTHHLQEPLRKIRLFSSRFESKLKKVTNTEGEQDLKSIQRINAFAADSQELLHEFLTFANLNQANKKDIETVIISEIIKTIWAEKKEIVKATKATYTIEGNMEIEGYHEHIVMLFEQLIDNALKFKHPDRKPVLLFKGEQEMIAEKLYHVLTISDNGIGFEQEYAHKIFLIFQRLNHKREYEGLGVGLAISRKIVEQHDGTISVESSPEKGSIFTIKIPIKQRIV